MELAIQKLIALSCFVIGLSHILQPRAWAQLFIGWRERGDAGVFYTGLLHFTFGALIVAFHNVWQGIPLILTIIGWGYVLKSLIYFVYPAHGLKVLARVKVERSWEFVVGGVFLVALGGLLTFSIFSK